MAIGKAIIITDENGKFIDAIGIKSKIKNWAVRYIMYNDNGLEYQNGGRTEVLSETIVFTTHKGTLVFNMSEKMIHNL